MTKEQRAKQLAEKLSRHAASAQKIGNSEEATTFAAKAAELADKYGFEVSDTHEGDGQLITYNFKEAKYYEKAYLFHLGSLYGVAVFTNKYKRSKYYTGDAYVVLHGKPNSIEMVKNLYFASRKMVSLAFSEAFKGFKEDKNFYTQSMKKNFPDWTDKDLKKYINKNFGADYRFKIDFYSGLGAGIRNRVEEARQKYAVGLMEIISTDLETAIESFKRKKSVHSKKTTVGNIDAYHQGLKASGLVGSGNPLNEAQKQLS